MIILTMLTKAPVARSAATGPQRIMLSAFLDLPTRMVLYQVKLTTGELMRYIIFIQKVLVEEMYGVLLSLIGLLIIPAHLMVPSRRIHGLVLAGHREIMLCPMMYTLVIILKM